MPKRRRTDDSNRKDESIESIAANDDIIPEQQQDTTDRDVIGEENSIGKEILIEIEKNERETVFTDQDENLIEFDSDIEQINQTNVDNPQVGQDSGFKEPPFSEHNEFGVAETEVVNTDDVHVELSNDDESKSLKQTSETYNETEIHQISTVQDSADIDGYTTPPEISESSNTKTINNDNSVRQEDDTDNDTDERELEDDSKPEEKSNLILNTVHSSDDEDFSIDDISKPKLKDDSELAEEKIVLEEENERQVIYTNSESKNKLDIFFSDDEDLDDELSIKSISDFSQKEAPKSLFTNSSKGEKTLLLFVALSSATFVASFIASILGKPLCPDEKGNLISLAILGTVAIVSITVSLAHFYCSNKSKEESLPLDTLGDSEVVQVLENKKNR